MTDRTEVDYARVVAELQAQNMLITPEEERIADRLNRENPSGFFGGVRRAISAFTSLVK